MHAILNERRKFTRMSLQCLFILWSIFFLWAGPALAGGKQVGESGPKPVGAVSSSNGNVYEKGKYGVILKYETVKESHLYKGSEKVDFTRPEKGAKPGKKCSERSTQKVMLTLRAGLFENMDARLVIPYLHKEMQRKSFKKNFVNTNEGLGDLKLIGRYSLLSQRKKDPLNLAVGLGLKIPTGKTDRENSDGDCLPGYLQPGSGSWDPIFEVGAHKVFGRSMISSHLMYQLSTEGKLGEQKFEKPDVFSYNAAYIYALTKVLDAQIELNGKVKGKAKLEGISQDNTGGHMVHLTPGLHIKFYRGMHFGASISLPVYRNLNGTQLSEEYSVLTKLAITF